MGKKKSKSTGVAALFMGACFAVGAVLLMPTTMVFVVGMVPTAVALFSDTTKERTAAITIGPLNFAGTLIPLLELWQRGHTVDMALGIIADPMMLLYMFGGAGAGAFIFVNMPPLIAKIIRHQAKSKLMRIEEKQTKLVEVWGARIAEMERRK